MSRVAVAVLAALTLSGIVALVSMALGGAEPRGRWGYIAATLSFVLSAAQTAPVLSMSSRVGRGYWGAPLRRMADVLALGGLVTAPLLILVELQLPTDWQTRPSLWFGWPGAPLVWDSVAIITLAIAGAALVWLVSWPDRRGLQWAGTPTQWRVLIRGMLAVNWMYALVVVFVHMLVVSDLALSLVPGWHSAVIPPYHVTSGFEAAIALVVVGLAVTRNFDPRVARSGAKLLLSMSLLWFYFVWCELLTYWYGRTPDEQSLLALFMFGPGASLFTIATVCELIVPATVLVWNPARSSPTVVAGVAAIVVVGNFVDRLRLFVGAWSVSTPFAEEHLPDTLPPLALPGLAEVVACIGIVAATCLVVVLALQRAGAVSKWEIKAVERLTPQRRVLRTRTIVVARPS